MPPSLSARAVVGEVEENFHFLAVLIENGCAALPHGGDACGVAADGSNRAAEALSGFIEEVPAAVVEEDHGAAGANCLALIDCLLHVVVEHPLVISHFSYLFH